MEKLVSTDISFPKFFLQNFSGILFCILFHTFTPLKMGVGRGVTYAPLPHSPPYSLLFAHLIAPHCV